MKQAIILLGGATSVGQTGGVTADVIEGPAMDWHGGVIASVCSPPEWETFCPSDGCRIALCEPHKPWIFAPGVCHQNAKKETICQ